MMKKVDLRLGYNKKDISLLSKYGRAVIFVQNIGKHVYNIGECYLRADYQMIELHLLI